METGRCHKNDIPIFVFYINCKYGVLNNEYDLSLRERGM